MHWGRWHGDGELALRCDVLGRRQGFGWQAARVGGGSAAPAGGHGFSLSREEAEVALREFRAVRNELWNLQANAEELTQIRPPADDPASVRFTQAAAGGGDGHGAFGHGSTHVKKEFEHFSRLVTRFEQALGIHQEQDESAGRQIRKSADPAGSNKGYAE